MKNQIDKINEYINRFLVVLDNDADHLQANIDQLNELRRLLIKHDVNALGQLLMVIQERAKTYYQNIAARNSLRQKLAAVMACSLEEITLTRLGKNPAVEKQVELVQRKETLQQLIARLKKEYISTQTLLADCSRFNRLLLKCLFENAQPQNTTYKPTGTTERQTSPVFMNMQL